MLIGVRRSGEALERRAILVMKDIVDREDTMVQSLDLGEAREIIRQVSWSEKSRPTSAERRDVIPARAPAAIISRGLLR